MKYIKYILMFLIFTLLANCLTEDISEDTSITTTTSTITSSEVIATNIDTNLIGTWAQYNPGEIGDTSRKYYVYYFYKNGKFDYKKCKDIYCEKILSTYISDGKYYNKNKNTITIEYKTENKISIKTKAIDTYFTKNNNIYYYDAFLKTKSYKDKSIYGVYKRNSLLLILDSQSEETKSEYSSFYTLDIRSDNTIKKTDLYKHYFDDGGDVTDEEKTTIIYDYYKFEDLGDRLVIKYPEKKYYYDGGKGPYYLHDIVYYEYYGDVIRWGSKDINETPAKGPPYYRYNSEKGVLENIYGFYEPYKKVE